MWQFFKHRPFTIGSWSCIAKRDSNSKAEWCSGNYVLLTWVGMAGLLVQFRVGVIMFLSYTWACQHWMCFFYQYTVSCHVFKMFYHFSLASTCHFRCWVQNSTPNTNWCVGPGLVRCRLHYSGYADLKCRPKPKISTWQTWAFGLRTSEEGNNENLVFLLKKKTSRSAFLSGFTWN